MLNREQAREVIAGPFPSLKLPFLRDGDVDIEGLRSVVDNAIETGAHTALLTWGDSLFSLLTDAEIAEVTRIVVEHAAGRAITVAADNGWPTNKAVQFAIYCHEVGADVLMVKPPNWAASCTVDTLVDHYVTISEHIPVMLVTNVFDGAHQVGYEVLKRLHDVDRIVAIKDDLGGEFAREMCVLVAGEWAAFSGGLKRNHLDVAALGVVGFMSTFVTFQPRITNLYWEAVKRNDMSAARRVIDAHETPLFDFLATLQGGWDAGMRGILEIFGIAGRWRRRPYYSLTDQELDGMRGFFQDRGWL